MKIAIKAHVSGKVQGVWFRGATKKMADQLNIVGYATNLADGRVEVVMIGEPQQLEKLKEWLQQGPPLATVTQVEWDEIPAELIEDYSQFFIKR